LIYVNAAICSEYIVLTWHRNYAIPTTQENDIMVTSNTGNGNGNGDKAANPINPAVLADIKRRLSGGDAPAATVDTTPPEAGTEMVGKKRGRPRSERKEDKRFLTLSLQTYVDALEKSTGFSRASVNLEMAVCLSVYAAYGEASLMAKHEVRIIYQSAGYACATHSDADYKTVVRRYGAAAALFEAMGGKAALDEITGSTTEAEHIQAIVNHLSTNFQLNSLNAVWAAAGRPILNTRDSNYSEGEEGADTDGTQRRQRQPAGQGIPGAGGTNEQGLPLTASGDVDKRVAPEGGKSQATLESKGEVPAQPLKEEEPTPADKALMARVGDKINVQTNEPQGKVFGRRQSDSPDCTVLEVGALHLAIPHDCPYDDIVGMITELMVVASSMEQAGLTPAKSAAKTTTPKKEVATH
jgi:hypothetical protein